MNKIYEYKVLSILDEKGICNIDELTEKLNTYGLTGWHVVGAYSNTLGQNSLTVKGFGINNTVDESIIILQREKKPSEKDLKKSLGLQKLEDEIEENSENICEYCGNYIKVTDKKCPICKKINPNYGLII